MGGTIRRFPSICAIGVSHALTPSANFEDPECLHGFRGNPRGRYIDVMRFVVIGAGAIGGLVGGRLFQAGHHVTLVARGMHLGVLQRQGLRLESPDGEVSLSIPATNDASEIGWRGGEVVLVAVKSNQTEAALARLATAAPPDIVVASLQNGLANEPAILRRFAHVQSVYVMCAASHLEPGVVQAWSSPVSGLLDVGRFPSGLDNTTEELAMAFRSAGFDSIARSAIWRWKVRKLLTNLANAVEAVCGPAARGGELTRRLVAEGEATVAAAGLDSAAIKEDRSRRERVLRIGEIGGRQRHGGSSWQSVQRGTGNIETDYLNGEVVLLGRLHGIPTPANEVVQQLAREVAASGGLPGQVTEKEVLRRL